MVSSFLNFIVVAFFLLFLAYMIIIMCNHVVEDLGVDCLLDKNEAHIRGKFASLICFSIKKFKEKEIDLEEVRSYVVNVFPIGDLLPQPASIDRMFEVIAKEKMWSYCDYSSLYELLEEFVDNETREKRDQYEETVNGHRSTVKLTDWMRKNELLKESISQLPPPDCNTLRIKLHPINITHTTLQYVYKLWNSIRKQFCLNLHAVLHDVERGCLEVTWHVPATKNLKDLFQRRLHLSQVFLKRSRIIQIHIDDDCIYPTFEVLINLYVCKILLNFLKLLCRSHHVPFLRDCHIWISL